MWHSTDPKAIHRLDTMRVRATRSNRGRGKRIHVEDLPGKLESFDDALRWLAWIAERGATGDLSAAAMRAATTTVRSFMAALDKREVTDKIKELQALVKKAKKAGMIHDD